MHITGFATKERHAADIGHDTLPYHDIDTPGRPVVALSIGVECHTGIPNYPFSCLGADPAFHTERERSTFNASLVPFCVKFNKKWTIPPPHRESGTCGVRIHYAIIPAKADSGFGMKFTA